MGGLQPVGGAALQAGAGQRLHQEQGRIHGPAPLLPDRTQPVLPQYSHHRMQTGPKERREYPPFWIFYDHFFHFLPTIFVFKFAILIFNPQF